MDPTAPSDTPDNPAPMPDLLGALEAILAACGDDGVLAALAAAARDAGFAGAMLVETDGRGPPPGNRSGARLRLDLPPLLAPLIDVPRLLARRELRNHPAPGDVLTLPGIGPARLVPVAGTGVIVAFVPAGRAGPDWAECGRTLVALATLTALCLARQRPVAVPVLRPRQREVLGWVAAGKTTAETAMILGLTRGAVEKHLRLSRDALDAATTAEAIARAARFGLI